MRPIYLQTLKFFTSKSSKEDAFTRKYIILKVNVTQKIAQYPLHHVTYPYAKYKVFVTSTSLEEDAFTRKFIILTCDLVTGTLFLK